MVALSFSLFKRGKAFHVYIKQEEDVILLLLYHKPDRSQAAFAGYGFCCVRDMLERGLVKDKSNQFKHVVRKKSTHTC